MCVEEDISHLKLYKHDLLTMAVHFFAALSILSLEISRHTRLSANPCPCLFLWHAKEGVRNDQEEGGERASENIPFSSTTTATACVAVGKVTLPCLTS